MSSRARVRARHGARRFRLPARDGSRSPLAPRFAVLLSALLSPLLVAAAPLAGCAPDRRLPAAPPVAVAARFLRPAEGDSLAGIVRVEAGVTDPALERLVLRVDGTPADTLLPPRWLATWRAPEVDGPSPVGLSLWGSLQGEPDRPIDSVAVVVVRNQPPQVRILWPRRTRWIERVPGNAISAEAVDPEEGPLPSERIRWAGSALRRPLVGATLPIELLAEDAVVLEARASDRWDAVGTETVALRPFRYAGAEAPESALRDLVQAYRAVDPGRLADLLDPRFRFFPCRGEAESAGWPAAWERPEFSTAWRLWVEGDAFGWPEWECRLDPLARWSRGDTLFAWFATGPSRLSYTLANAHGGRPAPRGRRGGRGDGLPPDTVLVHSRHAFLLERAPGGEWRVRAWHERTGIPGSSLASLLAAAAGAGGVTAGRFSAAAAGVPRGRPARPASFP